jgi:FkbM family methyltransferase
MNLLGKPLELLRRRTLAPPPFEVPRVSAIDAGAHGGIPEHWRGFERWLDVDGFDPDQQECDRLNGRAPANMRWHARGLARTTGKHKLHVLNRVTGSSLYPPNEKVISRYADRSYWGVQKIVDVDCISLEDFVREAKRTPHLLKLDTQGSELDILQGLTTSRWTSVLAVEVEVEFVDLYAGQPLFPDVDRFMRERGFDLIDLRTHRAYRAGDGSDEYLVRRFWNFDGARDHITAQLVAGDALYIRPLDSDVLADRDALLRYLVVTAIYHCYELSLLAVDRLETEKRCTREEAEALRQWIASLGPRPSVFDRRDMVGKGARLIGRVFGRQGSGRRVFWTERTLPDQ